MGEFDGRRALVTGAGAGIGKAAAVHFAREGASVACLDLDSDNAEQAAKEAGGSSFAVTADVSDESEVAHSLDAAIERLGGLDVLVNNAGITIIKSFEDSTLDDWDRTLSVNLRSMFMITQRALPALKAADQGSIVNIASMAAQRFTVPHVPYAASKGGVVAFTRDTACEFAPYGVRVNAVAPGPIATSILGDLSDEQIANAGLRFLLGRMGRPAEVAEAIAFLASPRASYITGVTLPVTGGAELATRPLRPEDT